jgi:hypothetical protein
MDDNHSERDDNGQGRGRAERARRRDRRRGWKGRARSGTLAGVKTLRARVQDGRLVLDEPTSFPEGTEVELGLAVEDELAEAERAALDTGLEQAWEQARRGEKVPARVAMRELRALTDELIRERKGRAST